MSAILPLRLTDVSLAAGGRTIIDRVSFELDAGPSTIVLGANGAGKSVLLRLMHGLLAPSAGRVEWLGSNAARARWLQAMVFQRPVMLRRSVLANITYALGLANVAARDRDRLALEALEEVGLDPATRHRYPHEFSGGQRQRVAIARAIVLEPRFIMLDEPTSALDMSVQAQVVDLLSELQKRHGLAYLFISHDLKVVKVLANQLIVLRHGKVVEQGPSAEIFAHPREDYTKALMAAAFHIEAAPTGVVAD